MTPQSSKNHRHSSSILPFSPYFLPIVLFFWPVFLTLACFAYPITWFSYLRYAQYDKPILINHDPTSNKAKLFKFIPYVPLSPVRVWKVFKAFMDQVSLLILGPVLPIGAKWTSERLMTKRDKNHAQKGLFDAEEICYHHEKNLYLDLYHHTSANPHHHGDCHGTGFYEDANRTNGDAVDEHHGHSTGSKSVVIYIHGGSWMSGEKTLYAPLSTSFKHEGFVYIVPNYRLYPKVGLVEMMEDIIHVIQWAQLNVGSHGGHPEQIYLMGHASGAHLCALILIVHALNQLIKNSMAINEQIVEWLAPFKNLPMDWAPVRGVLLVSGIFDIQKHYQHEIERGVEELSALSRMISKVGFDAASPQTLLNAFFDDGSNEVITSSTISVNGTFNSIHTSAASSLSSKTSSASLSSLQKQVKKMNLQALKTWLPDKWILIHGMQDKIVQPVLSAAFHDTLKHKLEIKDVELKLEEKLDHAQPIISLALTNTDYSKSFFSSLKSTSFVQLEPVPQ